MNDETPNETQTPDTDKTTILIRTTNTNKARWTQAATQTGQSLNQYITNTLNNQTILDTECQHPQQYRQTYPWSEKCLNCGHRFK